MRDDLLALFRKIFSLKNDRLSILKRLLSMEMDNFYFLKSDNIDGLSGSLAEMDSLIACTGANDFEEAFLLDRASSIMGVNRESLSMIMKNNSEKIFHDIAGVELKISEARDLLALERDRLLGLMEERLASIARESGELQSLERVKKRIKGPLFPLS